jgi:imidazolonepropionase-like amidohydrolase
VFQALGHLYVSEAGAKPRRLTEQTDHFEFYPSFSPDGRSVVYSTWNDESLGSVRVVPAGGGTGRVVTPEPGHYLEPRFSPDGEHVVFRRIAGGYLLSPHGSVDPGLWIASARGGDAGRISRTGFDAHFGPDPDRVYYSDRGEDNELVLHSKDLEGNDERTHLKCGECTEFRVSPDGRWIAFGQDYNAYVAPFTPTGRTVDVAADMKSIPVRRVSDRAGEFLHWSGDSKRLHWSQGPVLYTRELKDAFAFLDGAPAELPEPVASGDDLGFDVDADVPTGRIALVGARIVTMRDARREREVIEDGVVVVDGNRIAAVGPRGKVDVPADARRIDVAGTTIVPGLIDVHAHGGMAQEEITPQQNWMQYSNLSFGVTTIHDPSNDTTEIFAAAELQRAGEIVGPRIFSTGTILYGANMPGLKAKIDSLDDARFHVRRLQDCGAISVKSYQQPRRDQRQMVLAAARELGMMVVPEGGAKFQHNMNEIVDGHTGIEHALPLGTVYDDVIQLWSQTEVGYTPTLGVAYGGLSGEVYWYDRSDVWRDERLMAFAPRMFVEPRAMRRTKAPDEHYNLLEQGGFSPWEALRSATWLGAHYLGLDRDLGSIERGKLADLAIVDGNPLEDLRQSENVRYTMLNGRLYEAATMRQIAPDTVEPRPFFFHLEGGDTIHPTTQQWLDTKRRALGWEH